MNLPRRHIIPVVFCTALAGCGSAIPNCDDPAIRELVTDMVEDHYEDSPTAELSGAVMAAVDNIRTLNFNPETKIRQCVGSLLITGPATAPADLNKKTEIAYRIGPSDKEQGYAVVLQWP